jgi:hypothetical protein
MTHPFDDLHSSLHKHVADEIEHAREHPEDSSPHHHGWLEIAAEFAGEVAMELIQEYAPLDSLLARHAPLPAHEPHGVGQAAGDGFTPQTTSFTCALVSQKMILDQFGVTDPRTGQPVSESLLVFEATSNGWLTEHGTTLENMTNLLELHGIPCHHGHDWGHLVHDLAQGHQVAIAVNSDELWHDSPWSNFLHQMMPGHPDHAVVLKGLKVDAHGHVSVVINDPGRPDGAGVEYSLDQFQAALGSGSFHYIASDIAPEGWHAEAAVQQALHPDAFQEASHDAVLSPEDYLQPGRLHSLHDQHNHDVESADFAQRIEHLDETERNDFLRSL